MGNFPNGKWIHGSLTPEAVGGDRVDSKHVGLWVALAL